MTRFLAAFAVVLVLVATGITGAALLHGDPETTHPPHAERRDGATHPPPLAAVGGEVPEAVIKFVEGVAYAEWIEGVARAEWYAGVQADLDRQAREAAARAVPRSTGSSGPSRTYDGVGDCTGFAIPDYIIQRESGGNPYAVNRSSGAFGCAQVMPFHWAPGGACAELDRYVIDDQRTCVDWLSQGGTRLSPWAATR